jgi:hypothetical protein
MRHVDINGVYRDLILFFVRRGWISFLLFHLPIISICISGAVDFPNHQLPSSHISPPFVSLFFKYSWHGAWEKMDAIVQERKLMRE